MRFFSNPVAISRCDSGKSHFCLLKGEYMPNKGCSKEGLRLLEEPLINIPFNHVTVFSSLHHQFMSSRRSETSKHLHVDPYRTSHVRWGGRCHTRLQMYLQYSETSQISPSHAQLMQPSSSWLVLLVVSQTQARSMEVFVLFCSAFLQGK